MSFVQTVTDVAPIDERLLMEIAQREGVMTEAEFIVLVLRTFPGAKRAKVREIGRYWIGFELQPF